MILRNRVSAAWYLVLCTRSPIRKECCYPSLMRIYICRFEEPRLMIVLEWLGFEISSFDLEV